MPRIGADREKKEPPGVRTTACYGAAIILVVFYVNTFEIWEFGIEHLGKDNAGLAPIAVTITAVVLFSALAFAAKSKPGPAFYVGAAVLLLALFATDSNFPAKRIHIPQYLLLSLLFRYALCRAGLREPGVTGWSVILATLCGIHDELLQGFHPERSFGLRDIGVDFLGALSGGLIGYGLSLFGDARQRSTRGIEIAACRPLFLLIAVALFVAPLESFRGGIIPFWTILPLLAALLSLTLFLPKNLSATGAHWRFCSAVTASFGIYPLASHAFPFH